MTDNSMGEEEKIRVGVTLHNQFLLKFNSI